MFWTHHLLAPPRFSGKEKADECVCVCVFTFLIYISENSDDLEGKTRFPVLIN